MSKDDNNDLKSSKEHDKANGKRLKILLLASFSFFIFLILTAIFREDGIIKAHYLNKKLELLKVDLINLSKEHKRLKGDIYAIKTDPSYIEKIAREDLGLVKPDEVVFEFVENNPGRR